MKTSKMLLNSVYSLTEPIDWEAAYQEYLPRVYNFLRYRLGDETLAEDMTAAVFEKAWCGRNRYQRDLSTFSTWLFTIARNAATDHFRHNGHDVSLEAFRELADPASVEDDIQRRQDLKTLKSLLADLSVRERELVALKYGAGLTNREISRLTRLSESNVGTILNRVIAKLRLEMDGDHE
jgi:RNA polymerase sigma-70 factor (ECF subfamily)